MFSRNYFLNFGFQLFHQLRVIQYQLFNCIAALAQAGIAVAKTMTLLF